MDSSTYWMIYDAVAILVIALCVFANAKKGFGLIIISAAGYIISCVIASSVSNLFATAFYDNFLKGELTGKTHEIVSKYDVSAEMGQCISDMTMGLNIKGADIEKCMKKSSTENLDDSIYKLIKAKSPGAVSFEAEVTAGVVEGINTSMRNHFEGKVPVLMVKNLCSFSEENKEDAFKLWKIFSDSKDENEITEKIEESYIRETTIEFVKLFMFIVIVFVLMVIFKIIEKKAISMDKVFSLGKFDNVGGGIAGLIESAALMFIICILVKFALLLIDGTAEFFNEDIINQSKIFSIFYNFNLMG